MNSTAKFCLFLLLLMTIISCSKDDESAATRADYLGTYMASEKCGTALSDYLITVTAGNDESVINIANFYGVGVVVEAVVDGDTLSIESQMITTFGLNQTFEGSGALIEDEMRLYYSVETPGVDIDDCTAICTKQ